MALFIISSETAAVLQINSTKGVLPSMAPEPYFEGTLSLVFSSRTDSRGAYWELKILWSEDWTMTLLGDSHWRRDVFAAVSKELPSHFSGCTTPGLPNPLFPYSPAPPLEEFSECFQAWTWTNSRVNTEAAKHPHCITCMYSPWRSRLPQGISDASHKELAVNARKAWWLMGKMLN